MRKTPEFLISDLIRMLSATWGPQNWWPAETPFEVIAGAILVQNTAWTNAARALDSLRAAGALSPDGVRRMPLPELESLVRSSGYFRQKALRLKTFVQWLDNRFAGSLEQMFRRPTAALRTELLELNGFGHETVDTILLYAAQQEIFVVDAYTRRILERHDIIAPNASYDDIRQFVERALYNLPEQVSQSGNFGVTVKLLPVHDPSTISNLARSPRAQIFNEAHALFVQVGKHYCHRGRALCEECPLRFDLSRAQEEVELKQNPRK